MLFRSRRVRGFAAVWPSSVAAGIIDSSSGNASVTPAPCRKVRRDKCVLVMKDIVILYFFTRFWNESLSMMPMTSEENRLLFVPARRTIARTVGIS